MSPDLKPGIRHQFSHSVPDDKTVLHLYPEVGKFQDMPEVFATGFVVGPTEGACQLGTHVNFSHRTATRPGVTVTVDCAEVAVEDRRKRSVRPRTTATT